jgi:TolA-binding protein
MINGLINMIQGTAMLFRNAVLLRVSVCLICLGGVTIAGCSNFWLFRPTQVASHPSAEAKRQYNQAVASYLDGQYEFAAERFEAIRQQTTNKRFALMALYGLACSRLMAADSPEEYHDALVLWDNWIQHVPDTCAYEDTTLFDPLIKEKMLFSNIPMTEDKQSDIDLDATVPRWLFIRSQRELTRLNTKVAMAQRTIERRQRLIESLEKEIDELKRQIKALETIDQKIQKKKNAIPSTDSPPIGDIK